MSFGKCYYLNGGASTYQVLSGSEYNKQHSIGGHAAKFAVWRGPILKCFTNVSCVPELNEFVNEWINELINKQVNYVVNQLLNQ